MIGPFLPGIRRKPSLHLAVLPALVHFAGPAYLFIICHLSDTLH
jgi:hypothetical protein